MGEDYERASKVGYGSMPPEAKRGDGVYIRTSPVPTMENPLGQARLNRLGQHALRLEGVNSALAAMLTRFSRMAEVEPHDMDKWDETYLGQLDRMESALNRAEALLNSLTELA